MAGVYVIDNIPVQSTPVDTSSYSHFDGIRPLTAYDSDVTVQLLIGQDNAEAFVPLYVKRGKPGEPFSMRTLFGWCINGQSDVQKTGRRAVSNFVSVMPIDEQAFKLWEIENEGLDDCQAWSIEDKAVIDLWDREVKKVNGHFELPIPWKDRSQTLPNIFVVAKKRIDSLFKKFDHDADYCAKYSTEIDKLLGKNYAERVPADELYTTDRTWYLPHFGVTNDEKPDKLRVVFDCASKFHGESLNTRCLQGPDLVNNMLSVLLRFCQHSIAIQADIESMYHQVSIPPCDRDALRFLWYSDGKLEYYRMTSHLSGGVWCSASSTLCTSPHSQRRTAGTPVSKENSRRIFLRRWLSCFSDVSCWCQSDYSANPEDSEKRRFQPDLVCCKPSRLIIRNTRNIQSQKSAWFKSWCRIPGPWCQMESVNRWIFLWSSAWPQWSGHAQNNA